MKAYTTDPGAKGRFIRSLRELADYLDRNIAVPVPAYGASILLHASSADDGGRAQVDRIATLLGADVNDDTALGGHYWAVRAFGPIGYEIVAITDSYSATFHALMSYDGSVIPDSPPGPSS
jgi:hypothetical protein